MHPAAVTTTPGSIASGPYEPRHMLVNHVALGLYYAVVHLAVGAAAGALDPRTVPARRSDRLCKGSAERTQEFPLHTRCTPTVAAGQRPRGEADPNLLGALYPNGGIPSPWQNSVFSRRTRH